jgi:hypothetical protein
METTMAIFQVWHRQTPTFLDNDAATLAAFPSGFAHVADCRSLEAGRVFQLTNHIDGDWLLNPEVTARVASARSTSVGDVFVLTNPADGSIIIKWSVEMIGLRQF